MYEGYLWAGIIILLTVAVLEIWNPRLLNEGFTNLVSVGESAMWSRWMPRRGDIGSNADKEEGGYIRELRYFSGYTDVQRLGKEHDFCRMVAPISNDPKEMFFACALGGTDGLSTVKFRTQNVRDGLQISRDDYMNDVLKEGRAGYCRILKTGPYTFEAKCNPASDVSFRRSMITDSNPPDAIQTLLTFYDGIMFWLRLRDDMLDYAQHLTITSTGNMKIDEVPKPITQGLEFNGVDQFLRIGDGASMEFGNTVQLRYLRAISFWVYFDEFTNNAHLFDFGNGANHDNVFCGIIGRGNANTQQELFNEGCMEESQKTLPTGPSGAQPVMEQSPQLVMATSRANVETYDCPHPEIFGRIMPPLHPKAPAPGPATHADMLYEIWDNKMRKLHIQVKNVFPIKKWTHIVITTTNNDAMRPGLAIYQNAKLVHTEKTAWLPQTDATTKNYIGKSNWTDAMSQYDNKDELFSGRLFDFRGYNQQMTKKKIDATYQWGKQLLGITSESSPPTL
uniref:Uncharacterized protein n=1 Tax=viral metagenome TaxID=1070528 RepID=A0A6C0HJY1_9ZZZZ